MMMRTGKQTYRSQIRSLWIWALLVAVLMAVIVPGAQAALSENRTRGYHNFFVDRTGLEPDLNAELHWVYGNFYDDFASGSLVAPKSGPKAGEKVFRVWGDEAGAYGRSWTRTDPRTVKNYRDAAGLPKQNSGRFVTEGRLKNTKGVTQRDALSLHGNKGGLDEIVVPDPSKQIRVDRVSGVNPEF